MSSGKKRKRKKSQNATIQHKFESWNGSLWTKLETCSLQVETALVIMESGNILKTLFATNFTDSATHV